MFKGTFEILNEFVSADEEPARSSFLPFLPQSIFIYNILPFLMGDNQNFHTLSLLSYEANKLATQSLFYTQTHLDLTKVSTAEMKAIL